MNLETVHQLSLYDLRQELTKRGAWDLPDEEITYRNVLARAVALLVNEKEAEEQKRAARQPTTETIQERLMREKEERKREAIERSKQRQAQQPDYFTTRIEANKQVAAARSKPKEAPGTSEDQKEASIEMD